jgi:hypothetical protein
LAKKAVMNIDGTISHSSGSTTSGGSFSITSTPSLKSKASDKYIYRGTLSFTFSGGNSSETFGGTGIITSGTVYGNGTINPTAIKSKDVNQEVIRKDDSGSISTLFGTFVPSAPPNTPVPNTPLQPTNVEVSDAGQTKSLAE